MSNLTNNTTKLETLLARVQALPDAGSTSDFTYATSADIQALFKG